MFQSNHGPFQIVFVFILVSNYTFSGYMPPEYAVHGQFSMKSDVFSYGVIVLELVSGKKNREFSDPENYLNLLGHVSKMT